ncbi:insulinase family protein [Altererythrobacter sp. BO-6]|uniref:M16 family metallopeptidase n=1 Tax=Altererythrobacter sp. BO-6 TaxID=2604537 RepID=UPI0013E126AC|nr:pitrilysin family protein [Altererythrobacter sp. BO-6]QIG54632.1 insulinase family protein [Altererythrobacter sp. BO-6]
MTGRFLLASAAASVIALTTPALADDHAGAAAPTLSAPKIEYTRWVLDNGLQVIAIPDNSTANVTTSLWYEVGAKHDPEGRSGFSHLFEHILSRQTLNMPYNMINKLTEDVGGQRNASNWVDRTNYFETVPAEYLETMLWTHRERMAFPVVDSVVFEKERDVVKEELRQRVLAPPYGRLQTFVITENAYDVLPMRRPGIGSIEDLDSATLDDARAFHQAYYGPDTATLIVAGNFEIGRLRQLVDQYFADIPRRANPISLDIEGEEPQRTEPRTVNATAPNVPLPVVGSLWKAPPATHPDAAALEVLSAILARGNNSRMYEALVRSGLAVNALHNEQMFEDAGFLASSVVLSPAASIPDAQAALAQVIDRIRTEPVSAAELREAKNEIFSSALSSRQTAQGRAFELGEALVSTGDPDAADIRLERIAAVTIADVQRVAQAWLRPDGLVNITYQAGEDNPASYANPVPRPQYDTVPPPTGKPLAVRPEAEREAPPPPIAAPEVVRAEFVETQLANGIPLVSAQTTNVPIATITLLFRGGNATDPAAKAGLAGLAASVADKGTASRSASEIATALESLGARLNFSSGMDGSFVSLTAPTANLREAGTVLVDILQNASFPERELETERKRLLDGLSAAMKDPGTLASFVEMRVMYGDAPYGMVANASSIPAITRDDLIAHRETYWHPGAARIVISGGLSSGEAEALAGGLFGDWTSDRPVPAAIDDAAGAAKAPRTIVIDLPNAGQAAVRASVRALARQDADYYDLWLTNTVLGSGSNGRLFEEVRTKRALSYGAYSSLDTRRDEATLTAQAQTKNETADEVAAVFLDQFALLGKEALDEDALQKRRLFLGGALARSLETSGGFNGIVASLLLNGLQPKEAFEVAQSLANVTPDDVRNAAAKYLAPERASLVIVGDAQYFLDDLKALRGEVEVIPFSELDLASAGLRKPQAAGE